MSDPDLAKAIVITFLIFLATVMIGWVGSAEDPSVGEELIRLFDKEVASQMDGKNPADMCVKIFANNLEACILLFLGGATFGIFTLFIMSLNGIVIGAIMEIVHQEHTPLYVASAILPHGIFEIPGFILAGALGILLARSLVAEWYGSGDAAADARRLGRLFLLYVLPLIAIAAVVEAFITPVVIHLVA